MSCSVLIVATGGINARVSTRTWAGGSAPIDRGSLPKTEPDGLRQLRSNSAVDYAGVLRQDCCNVSQKEA